ncbi:hypothetical protein PR002_g12715 [Phytophthora rubi]|uniref:EF-hand domain-containing protein n=1 Tax=Phytophthora rubi TaxID=129364 RepID=A0A6A3LK48_9STRA|nr:hypothetical protein PR002_g12715 [Phytophthora rubi]
MLRSPSVLPGCKEKEKLMRNRQVLSASISAEALIVHEEKSKPSRRPVQFAITDILPGNQKTGKKVEAAALPASLTTLGPLSLPRPGKSDALSPTNGTERNPPAAPKLKKELASPVQISSSLENYAERLEKAENTELFAYASALCHRVTGRYLPRTLLQSDPEAQQRELERVQHDPEILRAIDSVRVLSAQFKDVAQNTMGHRRELGHTLFRIEESYLKLFEKLLELSLRLYWEYEQRTEAQHREDRAAAERWREKYERKCTECVKINKKMAAREIIHRAREIELQDYRGQMKEIENELGSQRELEAQILQLQDAAALQRVLERKLRDDFAQLTVISMPCLLWMLMKDLLQAQHKQLINDLRRTVREKDRFITKQETTLRQLEEIVAVPPVVYESRSSQTEVDDDGLWDVQDGIPRFVSKSALHKMMWRRFNAFVACKNCGGRPIPKAAKTNPFGKYPQDGSSEDVDVWSVAKGKKHTKKVAKRIDRIEQQWELPSHTVLFLSNLPKSVVAFPFYSLEKVISQIEAIYDDKFVSDRADEADGVAREELRRDGIKRDLTALFDAGDLNHDCVLTLDEFGAIIRKRKPHFSDRRILRMFREALMGGVDQSFALSMEAFVVVCNDHGLVSLLPDDRMVDPFAVSSKLVPKNSGPEIARTTDSPVSVVPEIPEDIPGELPTARAEEVDEDGDEGGGNQRQTRENAEAVAN